MMPVVFGKETNMRRFATGIVTLLLVCMMVGCGKKETRDSYVEGTDFQYQYQDRFFSTNMKAKGKDSTYFVIGSYIYQFDEQTEILTPLCNKSNCLHDKETDENRTANCNAYISENTDETGIAYMEGNIYSVMQEWQDNDICDVLYKVSADGATREKVYQWEGQVVDKWCVHRGAFYYVEHTFDEENQEGYKVKKMELSGMGKGKAKTIYEPDKDITVYAFDALKAYGNHLYINVDGAKKNHVETLDEENWQEYSYNKTFQYHLQDETLSEIRVPDQSDTEQISSIAFWQDKLLFGAMDTTKLHQYDVTREVYIADLDGTNAAVLLEDRPVYRWYSSDGTYLYESDCSEALDRIYHDPDYQYNINHGVEVEYDATVNIAVYDKNMKLVDRMQSPIKDFPTELPYGIGDRMYVLENNEMGDGVNIIYWDKTKLGTYQGKEYSFTKLIEQKYSFHDLQQLEEDSGEE